MSNIQPFCGIRYGGKSTGGDVSKLIAPPYDVLDAAGKAALLAHHPANFVKIDLPHVPPKEAGPQSAYHDAAAQFHAWLNDGTLVQDDKPALYAYHQTYQHEGRKYVRKMFFARLRLEEFGKGSVFPHEQTFGGPKADRLLLTQATRCNLSPIFGLYEDERNAISARLDRSIGATPLLRGDLDSVRSDLWAVTDPGAIADVRTAMSEKATFIADGHHRYGTALNYRAWLTEKQGPLPADHPANFVLCVFCAMEDAGLLILPTHRVLPGLRVEADFFAKDPQIEAAPLTADSPDGAVRELARFGPQAVGFFESKARRYWSIRPRRADLLAKDEPTHSDAWRGLALAFLHAYLLDRQITPKCCGGSAPTIHYVKAAAPAVDEAATTGGCVFLLQPTTMAELRAVCRAGDLMPQKSTYFFPKLASGLIVNSLTNEAR
ncbi:MAG: DUF1015 domain-containing protein [Planctomycetes bacterium]|nr:DUF1015 domain-containing protein [Planctomycetota bacterium]